MNLPILETDAWKDFRPQGGQVNARFQGFLKDRITVLFGGSVAGYKWKPVVIWHGENPGLPAYQ